MKRFFIFFIILINFHLLAEDMVTVRVREAKLSEIYLPSYYGARIEAFSTIKHYSTVNGIIMNLKIKEGDRVQKGETICLIRRKIGSESYQPAVVTSIISGIIVSLKITENMEVFDKSELFSIADDSKYKITILVSDRDIKNVKLNEECYIKEEILNKESESVIKGFISSIGRLPTDNKGLFSVEITLEKNNNIFIGKFVTVELRLNKHNAISVPQDSVVKKYGKNFVFVIEGENIVKLREVKLGQTTGDSFEILEGLKEKERFVISPPATIRDGDKVNIRSRETRERK